MPWYRDGTVAVTAGQTTVIGTGTDFSANCRVGDAFLGPDGAWYEVTNVASGTVLAILPPYRGATTAGATYSITPVQGYPKTLADEVKGWVNTYGQKMAALGTTGNYDILPVSKGGTGGVTAAEARTNMGLGSAATATLTATVVDKTTGRVLKVGDHGLAGPSIPEASWNNINATGFSSQPQAVGGPITGSAGWYANGINILYGADTRIKTQIAIQVNGPGFATRNLQMDLSSATAWVHFWNTGNTTVDASGFIKKASPIVRICDPGLSTRDDLSDGFTVAGYGAVNDEAAGVVVERIELGRYRILGSLGLSVEGWQVNSPSDRNGGKLLGLASGENQADGSIIVEFRKARYTLSAEGDLEQVPGPLIEAPLDSWIDVRLQMPERPPYVPPAEA